MRALLLAPTYLYWHYSRALKGIAIIVGNLMWFLWHFFSIKLLLVTLFSPWQRLEEHAQKKLDFGEMFSAALVTTVMRIVGFIIRSVFILLGLFSILIVFIGGIGVFVVWLILPLVIVFSLVLGFILLFRTS